MRGGQPISASMERPRRDDMSRVSGAVRVSGRGEELEAPCRASDLEAASQEDIHERYSDDAHKNANVMHRCATCAHWVRYYEDEGYCSNVDSPVKSCEDDFGCVLHKEAAS